MMCVKLAADSHIRIFGYSHIRIFGYSHIRIFARSHIRIFAYSKFKQQKRQIRYQKDTILYISVPVISNIDSAISLF